ncbi:MAG: YARHG domain-containing protein, partial [bacterium]|nr:YARHG domain-containing protein [bacterium]
KTLLRLLRNEIYAQHGMIFKSNDLSTFFENFKWYKAEVERVTNLNEIEVKNVRYLMDMERKTQ